jgi:hypothetical protein
MTLPYGRIECNVNSSNIGGVDNSITPTGNPYFSVHVYTNDFSAESVSLGQKWIFFHELTHAWQYYHRTDVLFSAIGLALTHMRCGYDGSYPYSLKSYNDLTKFNIEQQASIVADYWVMTKSARPIRNTDPNPAVTDYWPYIRQLQNSGEPHIPSNDDYNGIMDGRQAT